MQTKIYQLSLFIILFGIACQKPLVSYESAISTCKPDTIVMGDSKEYFLVTSMNCVIGAQLPEFTGTTMDGKKIDTSYFEGKVSVINFWFEGCMACEHEMPYFNQLVETYKSKKVNFLAIGRNSPKDITDFLVIHPFNFEHIAYGEPITIGNFKMTWGYPTTFVVDKHLKIIYTTHGVADENGQVYKNKDLAPIIDNALGMN